MYQLRVIVPTGLISRCNKNEIICRYHRIASLCDGKEWIFIGNNYINGNVD